MTRRAPRPLIVAVLLLWAGIQKGTPGGGNYRGWQVEAFGPVGWAQSAGVIALQSTAAPGGLFFRRAARAEVRSRLTIEGHAVAGHTTVRLAVGGGTPQWFSAPEGSASVPVAGGGTIEVVVYSDTPYAYQLRGLRVDACADCESPATALSATFPGWQGEIFGVVEWTPAPAGIRLTTAVAPGGIIFRRPLDPQRSYRLTIDGQAIAGATTARLTLAPSMPQWLPAPTGRQSLEVSGRANIELVFYSDAPYSYDLRRLTLEDCTDCLTDARFRELVMAAVPSLKAHLDTDRLAAARELLDWAANTVDISDSTIAAQTTAAIAAMSPGQVLQDIWRRDTGGTLCAGFAAFFSNVLAAFGYQSFTIDVGYERSSLTHVTTVLVAGSDAAPVFYLLDPTFNGTYVDRQSGGILPLDRVLAPAAAGRRRYRFATEPIARDYIYSTRRAAELTEMLSPLGLAPAQCGSSDATRDPRFICKHFPYDHRVALATWRAALRQARIPADADLILTLIRHRVISVSAGEGRPRAAFLAMLGRYGIPAP